jgi:hypothetical protein
MRPSTNSVRAAALVVTLAALAGCSEYLDRRDSVALGGGDSVATNKVTEMVDPWPRASANRDIATDGQVMESAVERYHAGRVYQPQGIGTSAAYQGGAAPANNSAPVGPTVTQPAAPVK